MKKQILALGFFALLLSGCQGGDNNNNSSTTPAQTTPTPAQQNNNKVQTKSTTPPSVTGEAVLPAAPLKGQVQTKDAKATATPQTLTPQSGQSSISAAKTSQPQNNNQTQNGGQTQNGATKNGN